MSAAVQPFVFENAVTVRTVLIDGEPWFVASDVAKALGYRMASDMTRNLDEDEKGTHILRTPGGDQQFTVVSEPGLYEAILRSRVESARAFKRWVKHEVLPQIRKTGAFGTSLPGSFAEALELAAAQQREIEAKAAELAAAAPKVEAFNTFMDADGLYSVEAAAKSLFDVTGMGRNKLFAWLRDRHILTSTNTPYQRYVDAGWFIVKVGTYTDRRDQVHTTHTTYVTSKGLDGIRQAYRRTA